MAAYRRGGSAPNTASAEAASVRPPPCTSCQPSSNGWFSTAELMKMRWSGVAMVYGWFTEVSIGLCPTCSA
jgi:hypothetical protein